MIKLGVTKIIALKTMYACGTIMLLDIIAK